jgi:hypothetical protein
MRDEKKSRDSAAGNRTPVSRVTGGDTHHYTTADSLACCPTKVDQNWWRSAWSDHLLSIYGMRSIHSLHCRTVFTRSFLVQLDTCPCHSKRSVGVATHILAFSLVLSRKKCVGWDVKHYHISSSSHFCVSPYLTLQLLPVYACFAKYLMLHFAEYLEISSLQDETECEYYNRNS